MYFILLLFCLCNEFKVWKFPTAFLIFALASKTSSFSDLLVSDIITVSGLMAVLCGLFLIWCWLADFFSLLSWMLSFDTNAIWFPFHHQVFCLAPCNLSQSSNSSPKDRSKNTSVLTCPENQTFATVVLNVTFAF